MTDAQPNLILIGLRASGKSTLGVRLGEILGRAFIDLDDLSAQLLESNGAGQAIETHGIEAFRDAEARALEKATSDLEQIISLGGGTPTAPGAEALLSRLQHEHRARVIYLRALPETLIERMSQSDNRDRPALLGGDAIDEIGALFEARDQMYQRLAESVVHTDGVCEDSVLQALVALARSGH